MTITLESHHALMRRLVFSILSVVALSSAMATLLHYLEPATAPINLIAPPFLFLNSIVLSLYLYRYPHQIARVVNLACLGGILLVAGPSWWFTLRAFLNTEVTLIHTLPPLTSALFLLDILLLIALRPQHLIWAATLLWGAIAGPVLVYLLLNPRELLAMRGLDLSISLGPTMVIQLILISFYNRLRQTIECLYAERLHYANKILERQIIRRHAIEQVRDQLHNGPLQSLAILLRDLQSQPLSREEIVERLGCLNSELRAVGRVSTGKTTVKPEIINDSSPKGHSYSQSWLDIDTLVRQVLPEASDHMLRLGEGSKVDLSRSLHYLLTEVYVITVKRPLPHFQTIGIKVRNFAPFADDFLNFDMKRDICLWLEEALCNVGKHACGATRLTAIGHYDDVHQRYCLSVRDNGTGTIPQDRPARLGDRLAMQLGGQFHWQNLDGGGVLCQLTWPVDVSQPQA